VEFIEYERFNDIDYAYDEDDEPVCVCADYFGTTAVTFCKARHAYTDTLELLAAFTEEVAEAIDAFAGRKPAAIALERTNAIAEVA
jgi:hypothetical protein